MSSSTAAQDHVGVSTRQVCCFNVQCPMLCAHRVIKTWRLHLLQSMQRSMGSKKHCPTLWGRWNMNHSLGVYCLYTLYFYINLHTHDHTCAYMHGHSPHNMLLLSCIVAHVHATVCRPSVLDSFASVSSHTSVLMKQLCSDKMPPLHTRVLLPLEVSSDRDPELEVIADLLHKVEN